MDRNYYTESYINKWEECLEEARKENVQDVGEIATYIFEESCNAEEVGELPLPTFDENDPPPTVNAIRMRCYELAAV